MQNDITLFKSITMFYGTDIIPQNIPIYFPHSVSIWGILGELKLSIPQNIVMDMNNVMKIPLYIYME
jgi:hypothetical protein